MTALLLVLYGCTGQPSVPAAGYALAFSGDGCVEVDMAPSALSEEGTIELTLRAAADASDLVDQPFLVWPGVVALVETEDGRVAAGPDSDPGSGVYSTESFLDGSVHHLAATWDADGRWELYTDGERVGFGNFDAGTPGTPLQIGCWSGGNAAFEGLLDEVRISTSIRYDDDFEPSFAAFEVDGETTSLWHFDEGEGEVAVDAAGGYDGTVIGAEWVAFGE